MDLNNLKKTTAATLINKEYRLTAIVSVYNSERFISGCLADLASQTIADRVEIIVIDSGSKQNEEAVVQEYQRTYQNIKYVKLAQRESVYAAWNRAIRVATGEYLTNANTDDRHAPHAFECMVRTLDERPNFALVYADQWITETENENFDKFTPVGRFNWKDYDPQQLIFGCYVGPQPMWRRALHEKYGYFDETFESA